MNKPLQNPDLALLLLRCAVGGLMLLHGIAKIRHGVGGIEDMLTDKGLPAGMAWGTYLGGVVAPILLLLGFMTRPAGLFIALTMLMSIWLAFGLDGFSLGEHGGLAIELNLLYLVGGLALFFMGGGRFSVGRGEGKWS